MIVGQWIAILVLLVSMTIVYTAFYRLSECQSNYMVKQYEAQHARVEVANAERDSLAHVFEVTVKAPNDREALKEAWYAHAALLERNNKLRAEHPLPTVPKSC